jgi:hypothetical protein
MGSESETDYCDFDVDPTAKSDHGSPHVADRPFTDRLVADHQDYDGDDNDNSIVGGAKLQLAADRPKPASPGYGSVSHQASPLRVNTEIINGSAIYVDPNVTKEVEDEDIDVLAKGSVDVDDDADSRSMKRSRSSAISCNDPASDNDVSVSEVQDE